MTIETIPLMSLENEIFFFQNDEINSNEIKSILTLHDQLRIPPYGSETQVDQILNKAIVGGSQISRKTYQ